MEHPTRTDAPAAIANFWIRIFAMLADTALLAAIGWAATYQFADRLIALGQNGRAIGLALALVYFGLLNSALCGGATLGKRLFGLRVVKRSGARISLVRSLWRAIVYLVPVYLNGWFFALPPLPAWQQIAFTTVTLTLVFGTGVATIYLYIFNAATRQTLHDVFAGTYVVKRDGGAVTRRTHPAHLVIVGAWLLAFAAGIPLGWPMIQNFIASNPFGLDVKSLTLVYDAVNAEPGVLSAQVVENTFTTWINGKKKTTTSLSVSVNLDHAVDEAGAKAQSAVIARRVLSVAPDILGRQELDVRIRYGYDIGVWSQWTAHNYSDTLANWKTALAPKPPAGKKVEK